ncbi:MAG TPA: glycosyltransferase family 4 protein [Solirubrobacteraceae bacterium]|jgi:glycosyltransferase involved in cell wall biosynthesis|nr:glycosyltransferase family 4 protein [Solirubrobacteraceae bacterium]
MRVQIVDPSAYTPPYDHALCAALAAAGADVELYTSRFAYGPVPPAQGYERRESFYRLASRFRRARTRRLVKLAEHAPDMIRYRRAARAADVVHFQWLAVQHLDRHLLPRGRSATGAHGPLVLTAHDILPREPRPGQLRAQRRLYERFDAIVVHSEHGRRRLTGELALDPTRVHVIPHGVFEHLASGVAVAEPPPLETEKPVVLCFGLMRPYKGIDLLLEAWAEVDDAELWIAGMPRMDIAPLKRAAPPNVRFVPRFITDAELPGYFHAAHLVVLPYREIDQSGVLFTALAFGKPLLLSDVGGFPEIAATGAARTFAAGDAGALGAALRQLLGDRPALAAMAENARALAQGPYSWAAVAARTLELYRSLVRENRGR